MKSKIFEKYKLINIFCFVFVGVVVSITYYYITLGYCVNNCDIELKKGLLNPIYSGGKWLLIILGFLLLFPPHIFKKWLFFVAPPVLLLTYFLVQGTSVYSGNLLNPTRAQMAENGMIVLAVITVVVVVISLLLDRKNKAN